jgi:hypothetical protein
MNVFCVGVVDLTGTIAPEQEKVFREATTVFVGAILTEIGDKLVDAYLHMRVAKNLWDALEAKFGATDAGSELYAMEQFHDYKMVDNRPVLDQAHEIQCIAKVLELLKCELPDKFVAGCIIAKLPPSWRNFATSLKHLRREFSVEDVIRHLSVEQNSRAKDSHVKGQRVLLEPMWCRRTSTSSRERTLSSRILPLRRRVRRNTKREMAALLVVQRNIGQTSAQTSTRSQDRTLSLSMSL